MWPNRQETADLVAFTDEILNGKLHFCAALISTKQAASRQATLIEALRQVQFLNSCNTFTREIFVRIQNPAWLNYYKNYVFDLLIWCLSDN